MFQFSNMKSFRTCALIAHCTFNSGVHQKNARGCWRWWSDWSSRWRPTPWRRRRARPAGRSRSPTTPGRPIRRSRRLDILVDLLRHPEILITSVLWVPWHSFWRLPCGYRVNFMYYNRNNRQYTHCFWLPTRLLPVICYQKQRY